MDGEAGAQVAALPIFLHHQSLPSPPMGRKRDFPWQNQGHQQRMMGAELRNSAGNWDPKMWDWDSLAFTAKPSTAPDVATAAASWDALRLGAQPGSAASVAEEIVQRKKQGDLNSKGVILDGNMEVDAQTLSLKLGAGAIGLSTDEQAAVAGAAAAARPNKKVRSGSPAKGSNYPMCQVDDCRTNLSNAKDYHRRHKVCEQHSKSSQALVGKQMQRFCQQCSRFHPLSEFDEGKRSCRRRLAGHNRRRRKTQADDVSSRILLPGSQQNGASGNLDIISLLSVLARLQGNVQGKSTSISLPDKDRLIQLLNKLNTPNSENSSSRLPMVGGFDLNVSQAPQPGLAEQQQKVSAETVPTMNLLEALSSAVTASSPETLASVSQGSSESSGNDKTKEQSVETIADVNSHNKAAHIFSPAVIGRNNHTNSSISYSPAEVAQPLGREQLLSLPLQLFGSTNYDSPPKVGSAVKYLSSESSNPIEERSPSSSPPVTHKLFPLHSTAEFLKNSRQSSCREENQAVELSTSLGWNTPINLFQQSERRVEHAAAHSVPYQAGYTSSSGSDHSPSSSNSDARDRTGRIIFKLFGKDPNCLSATLRADIMNWLSNSPSEMESHIRPGCVVLSVYLSMPSVAWEELEVDLRQRVTSLVQNSGSDFWRNGRFLVRTNRQLVSHKDGKIRLSKSWKAWSAPELMSVSPIAIVGGQESSLVLKGRNLAVPGTRIYCTHMGKYISKEVLAHPGTIYDDSSMETFNFPGGFSKIFGRCFIEVENGFKGNSFPLIIANSNICQELRVLESDFEEDIQMADAISEDQVYYTGRPHSREDAVHFLNELGWLFQKTNNSLGMLSPDFSCARFKYLFLFSIERDWCALTKALLDILADKSMRSDALQQEALEMLSEIHLLNRAVKRKCRKMVDLLLLYSVSHGNEATAVFLFPPNMAGPGGITPLHLAASTQDSEDIVDALTNDPQEIGLKGWNSLQDDSAQSPYMYAVARNNHSYNKLVARKIADKRNGHVTISVEGEEVSMDKSLTVEPEKATPQSRSCAQCALAGSVRHRVRRKGMLQWPYVHSLLAVAAVCVCVAVLMRALPHFGRVESFKWEKLGFGSM